MSYFMEESPVADSRLALQILRIDKLHALPNYYG
jgi:hypothetical protein